MLIPARAATSSKHQHTLLPVLVLPMVAGIMKKEDGNHLQKLKAHLEKLQIHADFVSAFVCVPPRFYLRLN